MKRFVAIASVTLFVACITAKDITALAWQIWYQVNQEYVAKELCVNKAKPQLQCNGKCHLMKQLRKLEEPTSQTSNDSKGAKKQTRTVLKLKSFDWISATDLDTFTIVDLQLPANNLWPESTQNPTSYSSPVFHPPTIA